jgi:hypothetical protein
MIVVRDFILPDQLRLLWHATKMKGEHINALLCSCVSPFIQVGNNFIHMGTTLSKFYIRANGWWLACDMWT